MVRYYKEWGLGVDFLSVKMEFSNDIDRNSFIRVVNIKVLLKSKFR